MTERANSDEDEVQRLGPCPVCVPELAHVGCEACGEEVSVPVDQERCPNCNAPLWEFDIADVEPVLTVIRDKIDAAIGGILQNIEPLRSAHHLRVARNLVSGLIADVRER